MQLGTLYFSQEPSSELLPRPFPSPGGRCVSGTLERLVCSTEEATKVPACPS